MLSLKNNLEIVFELFLIKFTVKYYLFKQPFLIKNWQWQVKFVIMYVYNRERAGTRWQHRRVNIKYFISKNRDLKIFMRHHEE